MASRYGHAWVSQYGTTPGGFAGAEWRDTLAGLSAEQFREGFRADRLRGAEWPPSSTAFRAMCLAVPSLAAVRAEVDVRAAARHNPLGGSAPAVRMSPFAMEVWSRLNTYAYTHGDKPDRVLREAFDLAREHVMAGGDLPEPVAELPPPEPPKRTPVSPEVAKAAFADIAAILGDEPPEAA